MRAKILRVLATAIVIAGLGAGGAIAISLRGPTVEELTRDIEEVDTQLGRLEEFAPRYAPGSILRAQSDLEASILRLTRAMLDQKRLSWLRGISLIYTIDGEHRGADTPLSELDMEIDQVLQEVQAAELNAAKYSGGLVQIMALVELQTKRVLLATLQQHRALVRLGFAFPKNVLRERTPNLPAGQNVDEKGAL